MNLTEDNYYEKFFDEPENVDFINDNKKDLENYSKLTYGDYPFYITDNDIKKLKNGEIMIVTTNFGEYTCYFKYLKEK